MIHFECDYTEGAIPEILDLLEKTNMEQTTGYGEDPYCEKAKNLIKEACNAPDADVYFLVGGTQTNKTVIQSILKSYQGVLSAVTGHINVHETGTIEAGGHKVLPLDSRDGKISARQVETAMKEHGNDIHCVQPAMVYISNPTEYGTIYSKKELSDLRAVCDGWGLPLFLDGARLAYALGCEENDIALEDYPKLCDVFYIGGTKAGALFGEAVVISNPRLKKDFGYNIKQNGGLLAKGRLLGIQFIGLFSDMLYLKAGRHGAELGMKLKKALSEAGAEFAYDSPTNQQFIYMPRGIYDKLSEKYSFALEGKGLDGKYLVRICTSWATKEKDLDLLIEELKKAYREAK